MGQLLQVHVNLASYAGTYHAKYKKEKEPVGCIGKDRAGNFLLEIITP